MALMETVKNVRTRLSPQLNLPLSWLTIEYCECYCRRIYPLFDIRTRLLTRREHGYEYYIREQENEQTMM